MVNYHPRFRKSFGSKGFRINVTKTGVGFSTGVPGLRYSWHSSGRRTTTVGLPGTEVTWRKVETARRAPGTGRTPRPRGSLDFSNSFYGPPWRVAMFFIAMGLWVMLFAFGLTFAVPMVLISIGMLLAPAVFPELQGRARRASRTAPAPGPGAGAKQEIPGPIQVAEVPGGPPPSTNGGSRLAGGDNWEFVLFASELERGIASCDVAAHDYDRPDLPATGRSVAEADVLQDVGYRLVALTRILQTLHSVFNTGAVQDAIGASGQPGDESKIRLLAASITGSYSQMLDWALQVGGAEVPIPFLALYATLARVPSRAIHHIRDFVTQFSVTVAQMTAEGPPCAADKPFRMEFFLDVSPDPMDFAVFRAAASQCGVPVPALSSFR